MRISDWSSDVCSSDLALLRYAVAGDAVSTRGAGVGRAVRLGPGAGAQLALDGVRLPRAGAGRGVGIALAAGAFDGAAVRGRGRDARAGASGRAGAGGVQADRRPDRARAELGSAH